MSSVLRGSCFFLGLLAVCVGLPRLVPRLQRHPVKWTSFREHADDYDVVFLGTSEVYFHVVPSVFEAQLARGGERCRAFNYGIGAMTVTEALSFWRAIEDAHPSRLKLVVIDGDLFPDVNTVNHHTRRNIDAHSAEATLETWHLALSTPRPLGRLARRIGEDWEPLLLHLSNAGTASRLLVGGAAPSSSVGDDGWAPADERVARKFDPRNFEQMVARARDGQLPSADTDRTLTNAGVSALVAEVRAAGYLPLVLYGPWLQDRGHRPEVAPTLDFSDPKAHPELFDTAVRWDYAHLNRDGARLMSRELADAFGEWLRRTGHHCAVR